MVLDSTQSSSSPSGEATKPVQTKESSLENLELFCKLRLGPPELAIGRKAISAQRTLACLANSVKIITRPIFSFQSYVRSRWYSFSTPLPDPDAIVLSRQTSTGAALPPTCAPTQRQFFDPKQKKILFQNRLQNRTQHQVLKSTSYKPSVI